MQSCRDKFNLTVLSGDGTKRVAPSWICFYSFKGWAARWACFSSRIRSLWRSPLRSLYRLIYGLVYTVLTLAVYVEVAANGLGDVLFPVTQLAVPIPYVYPRISYVAPDAFLALPAYHSSDLAGRSMRHTNVHSFPLNAKPESKMWYRRPTLNH